VKPELIQRNIESPSIKNVRKALKALPHQIDKIDDPKVLLSKLITRLVEFDERTKLIAMSTIRTVVKKKPETLQLAVDLIKKTLGDENPNVKASSIELLRFLITNNLVKPDEFDLKNIVDRSLENENPFLISSSLDLLRTMLDLGLADISDYSEKILNIFANYENTEVLSKIGEFVKLIYDQLDESQKETVVDRTINLLKNPSPYIRSISLDIFNMLIEKKSIDIGKAVNLAKKKLRDPKPLVKMKALDTFELLIKNYLGESNELLEIITKEILLHNVPKKLKLKALNTLRNVIDLLPQDLIHRFDIHRALDIIERNTVPKSPISSEIKILSRRILEEKLGLTIEKRRSLKK